MSEFRAIRTIGGEVPLRHDSVVSNMDVDLDALKKAGWRVVSVPSKGSVYVSMCPCESVSV